MTPCQCGCGQDAGTFPRALKQLGVRKGDSRRFINGHNARRWFDNFKEDSATGCWVWTGKRNASGYGMLKDGRERLAYGWMYEYFVGQVPEGLELDHLCRNRACVNPGHLEPVTRLENVRRGAGPKLTVDRVREIQERFQHSTLGARAFGRDVADEYGVSPNTIRDLVGRQRTWRDVSRGPRSERRRCPGCGELFHRQGYPNHLRFCPQGQERLP